LTVNLGIIPGTFPFVFCWRGGKVVDLLYIVLATNEMEWCRKDATP
jgi:hypothetical protein